MDRQYIAIDLKSFYASVECVERELDPLTTNLVVADASRTEKTICLAVTPSLKAYGISGRARLFEVVQRVSEVNALRQQRAPGKTFTGSSCDDVELKRHPEKKLDYIVAPPRMAHYMEYSSFIYQIYLKYVAPEDIHVYSIDEVFIDATAYLKLYHMDARGLAKKLILEIINSTGITATAGVGTNLYLCKVAMDIVAKHIPPDGVSGRNALSPGAVGSQAPDGFLAGGPGNRKKAGPPGYFHHGRACPAFPPAGALWLRQPLSAVRCERGAAHRSRLGL